MALQENKTYLTLILSAAFVVSFIAMPRASFAANCVSSFSIDVSGKAEVCPVSGTTANVSTAGTIGVPVSCPDAGNYVYHDYGSGGSSSQSGGGSGAPGRRGVIIEITGACECKKDCEQSKACNAFMMDRTSDFLCIGGKCVKVPEDENPNDCKIYVCKPGVGFVQDDKEDGESCTDELYCTSSNGKTPGPDWCQAGECVGKELDLSNQDNDFNGETSSPSQYTFPSWSANETGVPIEIPEVQYASELVKKDKAICCENKFIVWDTVASDNYEDTIETQINLDGLAAELCKKVVEIFGDKLQDCSADFKHCESGLFGDNCSEDSSIKFQVSHDITGELYCCPKGGLGDEDFFSETTDWYGSGSLNQVDKTIEGNISLSVSGFKTYNTGIQGSFDIKRSFSLDGSTRTDRIEMNLNAEFTLTYMGETYSPKVSYEGITRTKTSELGSLGECSPYARLIQ